VEEKPEVRHAGGVYYTPQYIVDYIVENAVGVKVRDKTPEEIIAIKICDPACGSGSFLLGTFQYLIEYHREWYAKANPETQKKYRNDFYANADNEIQLTHTKKTEILKNNIFGVDIDREAVEVAIMSLYLKLLDEGQAEMFLPDITDNIKCGNSLIGTDFYAQSGLDLGSDELRKVNCFDWEGNDGFTEIFMNGGFDVVIGNPPWVFTRNVDFGTKIKNYYKTHYLNNISKSSRSRENQTGKVNLYGIFIARGVKLLNKNGLLSFIIPNTVLRTTVYEALRKYLLENTNIKRIVDLKDGVFTGVTASTIILVLELGKKKRS
jgi:type I restriction-modification system DNA methylase subunit